LPISEKKEIKDYCEKLAGKLEGVGLRVKIFSKKKLEKRIPQVYQKKIPYYLVVGQEEVKTEILKLTYIFPKEKEEELLTEKELYNKLKQGIKQE
jgi:threonyl-tRNA synthetase